MATVKRSPRLAFVLNVRTTCSCPANPKRKSFIALTKPPLPMRISGQGRYPAECKLEDGEQEAQDARRASPARPSGGHRMAGRALQHPQSTRVPEGTQAPRHGGVHWCTSECSGRSKDAADGRYACHPTMRGHPSDPSPSASAASTWRSGAPHTAATAGNNTAGVWAHRACLPS
jgi:hypothetical protein